jgi:hypothetical protein
MLQAAERRLLRQDDFGQDNYFKPSEIILPPNHPVCLSAHERQTGTGQG